MIPQGVPYSLDYWSRAETWTASETRAFQEVALRRQLEYLEHNSPFYLEKARAAGRSLSSVKTIDDLQALPFTSKDEVRESLALARPLGTHLAAPPEAVIQIQASSGTTGNPVYVGLTARDIRTWSELGARALYANGFRQGDRMLHAYGMSRGFVGGVPVVQMAQYMGICEIPIGAEAGIQRLLRVLADQRPSVITGTPNFLVYLGEEADRVLGVPARDFGVRVLSVGGEPGGGIPSVRETLQRLWSADVREVLGGTDFGCIYWGECEHERGMHFLSPDLLLVELVNPETGERLEVRPGVEGELVYTALEREASPLLRFRSRDRVLVTATDCACGRTGMMIRCVGRTDDMLIVRGVNVFPSALQDLVGQMRPQTTGNLRVIVDFEGHSTQRPLKVRVERGPSTRDGETAAVGHQLETRIRELLGVKVVVELVEPGYFGSFDATKMPLVERVRPPARLERSS